MEESTQDMIDINLREESLEMLQVYLKIMMVRKMKIGFIKVEFIEKENEFIFHCFDKVSAEKVSKCMEKFSFHAFPAKDLSDEKH